MRKSALIMGHMPRRGLTLIAFLIMLAFAGTASADIVTLSLSDFVIFSGGGATYNQWDNWETEIGGHTAVTGNIGSNQDLFMQGNPLPGYPSQLNGSAYVGGYLYMGQDVTVGSSSTTRQIVVTGANPTALPGRPEANFLGNLYGNMYVTGQTTGTTVDLGSSTNIYGNVQYTGGTVTTTSGTNITGTVTSPSSKTFALIPMPAATVITAGGAPKLCSGSSCGISTPVTPGTYGALTIAADTAVYLSSGNYFFDSITAPVGADNLKLYIDLSSGQRINIYSLGDITFRQHNEIWVKGAGTGGAYVKISDAPSLASLIYWETHGTFTMGGATDGAHNVWGGTLYASMAETDGNPEVQIGQYMDWYGAVYAFDSLDFADHGHWNYVPLNPVPIPAAIWLLGSGLICLVGFRRRFKK